MAGHSYALSSTLPDFVLCKELLRLNAALPKNHVKEIGILLRKDIFHRRLSLLYGLGRNSFEGSLSRLQLFPLVSCLEIKPFLSQQPWFPFQIFISEPVYFGGTSTEALFQRCSNAERNFRPKPWMGFLLSLMLLVWATASFLQFSIMKCFPWKKNFNWK